ncbi:unnamed protein product [Victoria cruziana]
MAANHNEFPIFNGKNYHSWSIRMRAYLMSQDLWELVVNGYDEGDRHSKREGSKHVEAKEMRTKDGRALSIILEAIPESVVPCLADAMTSKEAWTILNQKYRGDKKEYVPQSLLRQFSSNRNIDEGVRAIPEVREHLDQPLATPSSSRSGGSEFEVFLSFRGEDTRNGFTGHLYDSLHDRGVSTFMDSEKLEKGEQVDNLLEYMEKSKICVLIISENYADSKWCLKEVAKCLECDKVIIPVFFRVDPSDVRNQSGPFKSAFKEHESNEKLDQEEVRKWREALKKVGNISGLALKDMNGDEAKLKRVIVERVLATVNKKPLVVAEHPLGIQTRVQDVKKMLKNGGEGVDVVGIHGMGGLGKTTIAKAVYNDLAKRFDGATCFLSNVRETAGQPNGLVTLQKQVFQEILKDGSICLNNVSHGQSLIKERTNHKRVLLVLDDVDSAEQLDALAGGRDWFGSGSVIIITTRDEEVLLTHNVKEEEIYRPQMLNKAQALKLFILHAFDGIQPQGEYAQLANQVVAAAGGLPLTIKVLGSLLSSIKDVQEWKDILEKVKTVPHKEVQKTLKISYDSLDEIEKKIFLDISYFFIGRGRRNATYMWEGCGWHPKSAIGVLLRRSLITINEESGEFEMHDQIRDMGREIVGGESSQAPEKHSRFRELDSLDLSRPGIVGTEDIEAIQFRCEKEGELSINIESFAAMSRLRMLRLENVTLEGEYERFPRNVKCLEWHPQGMYSLPSSLDLENMVVLDMSRSSIVEFWGGQKVFHQLKVLDLSYCRRLVCPDFTDMVHLEILNFEGCSSMRDLHPSIGALKSLCELRLASCKCLKELPEAVYELTSLEKLDLSYCGITALPPKSEDSKSWRVLGKLEVLLLDYCGNLIDCPVFNKMPNLTTLSFRKCNLMNKIDPSIGHLKSLIQLDLDGCSSLRKLPQEIGQLTSLKELSLSGCSQISSLPGSIVSLDQLEILSIYGCKLLKSLPQLPPSLIKVDCTSCWQLESIADISNVKGLQTLDLTECERLVDVPGIEQLKFLEFLNLGKCRSLCGSIVGRIKDLDGLEKLELGYCESLTKSPHFTSNMTRLEHLYFSCCVKMAEVDPSIGHLKALTRLDLFNCISLKGLPEEVCRLTSLEYLCLTGCCQITTLPESIIRLERLDNLSVDHCKGLEFLPQLPPSLTVLYATSCTKLRDIPGIEQLTGLCTLDLHGCRSLEDSFLERVESIFLKNKDLKNFAIPGRLIGRGSSHPQSLSFPVPKHLKDFHGSELRFYVDKSSNQLSQQEHKNDDSGTNQLDIRCVVRLAFSIGDTQFHLSTFFDGWNFKRSPVATFRCSELMRKVAEADADCMGTLKMQVSIDGCTLLHGHLFSRWQWSDFLKVELGDNMVLVAFD